MEEFIVCEWCWNVTRIDDIESGEYKRNQCPKCYTKRNKEDENRWDYKTHMEMAEDWEFEDYRNLDYHQRQKQLNIVKDEYGCDITIL